MITYHLQSLPFLLFSVKIISTTRGTNRIVRSQYNLSCFTHMTLHTPMSEIKINSALVTTAQTNLRSMAVM